MSRLKRISVVALLILTVWVVVCLVGAQLYLGAIFPAPEIDRTALTPTPVAVLLVQPRKAAPFLHALVNRNSSLPIPRWALDRVLPREAAVVLSENPEKEVIDIHALLSLPRFAPAVARSLNDDRALENMEEIRWHPPRAQVPEPGVVLVTGEVPMEEDTLDDVWMQWNQAVRPTPLGMAEGHLIEGLFDNRIGSGYLAMASLLYAFDIDLDDQEQDISLSSFQFVLTMRLAIDITNDNAVTIYFVIEVLPEAKQRLAVINLRVALEDAFEQFKSDLWEDHKLEMTGEATQTENIIEYEYRIQDAMKLVELMLNDEL